MSANWFMCKDYYRLQRSCGKVMFLHLSVILFTGGSLSGGVSIQRVSVQRGLCPRGLYPRGLCPGGVCPRGVSVQGVSVQRDFRPGGSPWGGSLSRGCLYPGGLCPGGLCQGDPLPRHCMVTFGRYASYWNAFFFLNMFFNIKNVIVVFVWNPFA